MDERVEHILAQKTRRQKKLPLTLLSLPLQIVFSVNFSTQIFTTKITNKFNRYF